jgi:hypothetical protein|tara:strand:+ start:2582 stop:2899 length:318 start_codon:yes stop_codon:yes gene_type:complete
MEAIDIDRLIDEITKPDEQTPAWIVLGGLMDRLDGCNDPQVRDAVGWVETQLAEAASLHQQRNAQGDQVDDRKFPQPILTAFGLCFLIGLWTVGSWVWQLAVRFF